VTLAALVDWDSLLEAVYISLAVGLGLLVVAAVAVASSLRAQDERAAGNEAAGVALGGLTVVCVAALAGAVAVGVYLLTQ
jgi:hypothetical protein